MKGDNFQFELPFESDLIIECTASPVVEVISANVIDFASLRLQRHAQAILNDLISEGLVERLEA